MSIAQGFLARRVLVRCLFFTVALMTLPFFYNVRDASSHEEGDHTDASVSVIEGPTSFANRLELPPIQSNYGSNELKPRHRFGSYEEYLQLQLKKTLNMKLRKLWTTKDWRRKVDIFSGVFQDTMKKALLKPGHKALCIGARVGQEVLALKENGVWDAIGIDLVPFLPLVVKGDMHRHPFVKNTFDFEFSNVFDHALFPDLFVSEVERTLKPGGVALIHVALSRRSDKYSANDLYSIDPLLALFKNSDVVHIREIDALGLDTEVAFRKRWGSELPQAVSDEHSYATCKASSVRQAIIEQAEPLIAEEPLKPWIALKQNMKSVKYLPTISDISNHSRHIYVDVGAREHGSSIGSWFKKQYPKQNQNFSIFAIEADKAFQAGYRNHSDVRFLPYAAWIRNESLMFGSTNQGDSSKGPSGMGRIQMLDRLEGRTREGNITKELQGAQLHEVQGFDFAEWLEATASMDDFLVLKMDVEGTEFELLPHLFEKGTICLVDELFLECHYNRWQRCCQERTQKYNKTYDDCLALFTSLRQRGVLVHQWW